MKKAVIILSGGMDSTVLAHKLVAEGFELHALSFNYNQRHKKELEFARYWGEKICKTWKVIPIDFLSEIASNSALTDKNKALPNDHYSHENQKITVVPNRNMVMLSIAVAHAENLGIQNVFYGAQGGDNQTYPDCRPEYVSAISLASFLGTYYGVTIEAPLVKMAKSEVAILGNKLAVEFEKTWSCYAGTEKHCGECSTCQARKEAFAKAGLIDPTEYIK